MDNYRPGLIATEKLIIRETVLGFKTSWLTACVLLLLFLFPLSVLSADIPEPEPSLYVLDQAGVMSQETKAMIINTSQELAQQTKAQVAVVTLKTLDGQPIEYITLEIGRKWQLGDKELNNGVLILVVPAEQQSRIEVGYGLEGALPDGKVGRLMDEHMLPAFRQGDYNQGLANIYEVIAAEVANEYEVSINIRQGTGDVNIDVPAEEPKPAWLNILGIIGILLLLWLDNKFLNGFFFGMLMSMLLRGGGRGGGGFGGGNTGGGGSFGGGGSSRRW